VLFVLLLFGGCGCVVVVVLALCLFGGECDERVVSSSVHE